MKNLFILFLISIVLLVLKKLISGGNDSSKKQYGYKKKDFLLSRAEHEFFNVLLLATENQYHVFPQVHLSAIIDHKIVGQNWRGAFSHVNGKSVDFVLCDKNYITPVLAIEVDDHTHRRDDHKERDREVERILSDAGLPLLRIENKGHFKKEKIKQQILEIISNSK